MATVRALRCSAWLSLATWLLLVTVSPSALRGLSQGVLALPAVAVCAWPLLSTVKVRQLDIRSSRFAASLLAGLILVMPQVYLWFTPSLGLLFAVAVSPLANHPGLRRPRPW